MNEAVERAHVSGALTHASLMVAGAAVADAVARARRLPRLCVGLHLVAVEGPAVLPHAHIPDLVAPDGRFASDQLRLGLRYAFLPAVRAQLAREVAAQFEAFAATGLALSHADAHKHMHLHPYVGRLLVETGRRHGLRRVRVPAEPPRVMQALGVRVGPGARALHLWTRVLRRQVRAAAMEAPEAVFGLAWTGHMTAPRVGALLDRLRAERLGDVELYFHPAAWRDKLLDRFMPDYDHEAELAALLTVPVAGPAPHPTSAPAHTGRAPPA